MNKKCWVCRILSLHVFQKISFRFGTLSKCGFLHRISWNEENIQKNKIVQTKQQDFLNVKNTFFNTRPKSKILGTPNRGAMTIDYYIQLKKSVRWTVPLKRLFKLSVYFIDIYIIIKQRTNTNKLVKDNEKCTSMYKVEVNTEKTRKVEWHVLLHAKFLDF